MNIAPCKGNILIIKLLPLQGVGVVWVPFTQGAALGYVLQPLRGVLIMSFDTLSPIIKNYFFCVFENEYGASLSAVPRCLLGSEAMS